MSLHRVRAEVGRLNCCDAQDNHVIGCVFGVRESHETARVHHPPGRRGSVGASGMRARAAKGDRYSD
jgi:hypothetical protein